MKPLLLPGLLLLGGGALPVPLRADVEALLADGTRLRATVNQLDSNGRCFLASEAFASEVEVTAAELAQLTDLEPLAAAASQQPARVSLVDGSELSGEFLVIDSGPAVRDAQGTVHRLHPAWIRSVRCNPVAPGNLHGPLSPGDWTLDDARPLGSRLVMPHTGSRIIRANLPSSGTLKLTWRSPAAGNLRLGLARPGREAPLLDLGLADDRLFDAGNPSRTFDQRNTRQPGQFAVAGEDGTNQLRLVWNLSASMALLVDSAGEVQRLPLPPSPEEGPLQLVLQPLREAPVALESAVLLDGTRQNLQHASSVDPDRTEVAGLTLQDGTRLIGTTLRFDAPPPSPDDFAALTGDGRTMAVARQLLARWTPLDIPAALPPAPWSLRLDDGSTLAVRSFHSTGDGRLRVEHPLLGTLDLPLSALDRLTRNPAAPAAAPSGDPPPPAAPPPAPAISTQQPS